MFNTSVYELKTFDVEAVQVTEANMREVAAWCGGHINTNEASLMSGEHIEVEVMVARRPVRARAYVGDWVTRKEAKFRVYGEKAFPKVFVLKG